jgi:hypothetical protein
MLAFPLKNTTENRRNRKGKVGKNIQAGTIVYVYSPLILKITLLRIKRVELI